MKKRKKEGFTLVELLATIAILAIVASFTIYVAVNLINNSKEKGYTVTINEIENTASNYLMENADRLFYISDIDNNNVEYQCITVENLIDYGYFKNDVINSEIKKNQTVSKDDYIYVERDKKTKVITRSKYILDDEELTKVCNIAVVAIGDISIDITPSGFSSYKDITITYEIKNANNINDYNYVYNYSDNSVVTVISSEPMLKKIRVTDNGTITANIIYTKDDLSICDSSKNITDIDKTPPVIKIGSDLIKIYGAPFDLYEDVTITDNSGVVASKKVYLGSKEINSYSDLSLGENIVTYKASDKFGNEAMASRKITLVVADKEFDYKEEDQFYQVEADGTYIIHAYGAQGGNSGGNGGYVKAEIPLKRGDTLIINTGGINGYNGGGAYKNNDYVPGGGATTVKYNDSYVVMAAGGGAMGNEGTPGDGGSGTGEGGSDVGSGAGLSGSNGGGGSNSNNYSYDCNCKTCGGGCKSSNKVCSTCHGRVYIGSACPPPPGRCQPMYETTSYPCNCSYTCTSYYPTYNCECQTCTENGKSGNGGTSKVNLPATMIENVSGSRIENGYVKIVYKLEG